MTKIYTILDFFAGILIFWLVLLILCLVGYLVEIIDNRQRKLRRQREALEDMMVVISDPVVEAESYVWFKDEHHRNGIRY